MARLCKFVSPLLALFLAGCATLQSTSNTHGPAAHNIARLSHAMSITFMIAIIIMWVLLAIALKKNPGSLKEHMPIDSGGGQAWVAIGGIAIPLLVLSVFFFLGLDLLADFPIHGDHGAMNTGPECKQVEAGYFDHRSPVVVGGSLSRRVDQQVVTANEIHIPAHRQVNIELRTADVIHAFWVPSLHGKVDLLPGNVNFIRIEASEPGNYIGQCAEYCGKQHANMHILLIAQEPAAFNEWLANQRKPGVQPTNPETIMGRRHFWQDPAHSVIRFAALLPRDGTGRT